jgi:hypothetical protein
VLDAFAAPPNGIYAVFPHASTWRCACGCGRLPEAQLRRGAYWDVRPETAARAASKAAGRGADSALPLLAAGIPS